VHLEWTRNARNGRGIGGKRMMEESYIPLTGGPVRGSLLHRSCGCGGSEEVVTRVDTGVDTEFTEWAWRAGYEVGTRVDSDVHWMAN